MYNLPYITISKDILIPHPGNNFTITLDQGNLIETKDIIIKEGNATFTYNKSFLIILASSKVDYFNFATLCTILNDASLEGKNVYHFSAIRKVQVINDSDEGINFVLMPHLSFTKEQESNFFSLTSFIKANNYLSHIKDNVPLDSSNYNLVLNQIINYLYPTLKQDYIFYSTKNVTKKINIINLLIINYHSDFKQIETDIYPSHVNEKIKKETNRLNQIPQSSVEYSNTLDYLDLITALPWHSIKTSNLNIKKIETTLNESHLGLHIIKENIIDHFSFEQLTQKNSGSYMLFDGPPGTGKTSIAKTIAKAIGRDFISIALGGVSDESEIRGHRRTYLGSRPGRIISSIQNLKSNNPVILLDEIDKISSSNKGDPYSALLEVLDTEQNSNFVDKYLEVPYDLSKAIIICTSNDIKNIPEPLKDRLMPLTFTHYSSEEKYIILTKFIIPNFLTDYALESYHIVFSEDLLLYISKNNNLRQIKRVILRLLKHSSTKIMSGIKSIFLDIAVYDSIFRKKENKKRIGF